MTDQKMNALRRKPIQDLINYLITDAIEQSNRKAANRTGCGNRYACKIFKMTLGCDASQSS